MKIDISEQSFNVINQLIRSDGFSIPASQATQLAMAQQELNDAGKAWMEKQEAEKKEGNGLNAIDGGKQD